MQKLVREGVQAVVFLTHPFMCPQTAMFVDTKWVMNTFSLPSDIDPPREFEKVESTETSLTLRWQKPLAKVSAYKLVYVSKDGQVEEEELPATATNCVISNLTPGMSYSITLTAERGLKRSTPVTCSASTGG